mmetsp:Transcript_9594/g.40198  ORF Transcript_9594/g.40198 Transcript_9594/m.40198 type:complete len:314 (+) Transcript_9594:222-1163(+)
MQSRWNTCPQLPHAMDNPSSEALVGLAWYSMDGSCRELRQIAHVSVQMDHDHTATAFHFFTSNRFFSATSAMIACEPGSRGRGATHTVRGRGEILKLVSIRGVEFANRNVFFDVRSKSFPSSVEEDSESRQSVTTSVARLKTVACLYTLRRLSTPLHQRVHERRAHVGHHRARVGVLELEDVLYDLQLRGRGVQPAERRPVVDDEPRADHVAAAVHRAGDERHLEQRRELVQVLDRGLRVHDASLVRELAVRPDENLPRHGLAENLYAQHVGDNLLRLLVDVGMDERDVVVARDAVSQRGQPLIDALHDDVVR